MICPNCNSEVNGALSFCENCGAALPLAQPQEPTVETPEASSDAPQSYQETVQQSFTEPIATPEPSVQASTQQFDQQATAQQFDQQAGAQQTAGQQPAGQQAYTQTGYAAPQQGAYGQPQGPTPSIAPFVLAIIALVTSILGLFPVSIILAIIALVMNSGQKKRGETGTKQTPTFVMSIISLVISALMLITTIILGGLIYTAALSGDFAKAIDSANSSTSSSVTTKSSSSASATTKSGSSASSQSAAGSTTSTSIDLTGKWELDSMTNNGDTLGVEDVNDMRRMGMNVTLDLASDGTATLSLFDVPMVGTWKQSASSVSITLEGQTVPASYADGLITMSEDGNTLVFHRMAA